MRLEDDNSALVAKKLNSVQKRLDLARVVGIIVKNIRTIKLAFKLKAPSGTRETGKAVLYRRRLYAEANARCRCGKGVFKIVLTGNMDVCRLKVLALVHDIKLRE